jgi:Ice-binding-like
MSRSTRLTGAQRAGIMLAAGLAFATAPIAAQAAPPDPVDLGTVVPFVVLGGTKVASDPDAGSLLKGELGVATGTSLTGFGSPTVVTGATHQNDGVARDAQDDLTTAYNDAAGEPVPLGNDLSGVDLGNQTLHAGNYHYSSSAQLTGTLILDAENVDGAQFVFQIGSQLTTAPNSVIELRNGASPCNVFWQVGSSAVLDTTTQFQGNLMALKSISLNNGASVMGRVLARNAQVSLINNVIDGSMCGTRSTVVGGTPGTTAGGATSPGDTGQTAPSPVALPSGQATTKNGTATMKRKAHQTCASGFRARVRGKMIKRVVFRLDGKRVSSPSSSPFQVSVHAGPGKHKVTARVTFKDATRAKTLKMRYRACAAVLQPLSGPSRFAG